ncbi:hypothetical protein CCACVL1_30161 [Corchorus capsularis]|uniref:Uncharacterized protein n=1 Tax=Corchorus capsularis TaxID=210143 RepID=A0A1R3FYI8_COCAP|nr:hypothetical protein CCACVL1_30161 [Corchorus capsularis]
MARCPAGLIARTYSVNYKANVA